MGSGAHQTRRVFLTRRERDERKKWSPPIASTLMSCKSSSPTSLLQTLLLSLKYANLFWLAHFPGYIARSAFITTKPKDIQEYATRLSLESLTPLIIYTLEKIVTPFAVVKTHPNLAAHVQNIGLRRCLRDSYLTSYLTLSTLRYTCDPQYPGQATDIT